jgi:hypothetical protein
MYRRESQEPRPAMKIRVSDPSAVDDLVTALSESECVVSRTDADSIEVGAPWQIFDSVQPKRQAELELTFFLRAWEARHPGIATTLFV